MTTPAPDHHGALPGVLEVSTETSSKTTPPSRRTLWRWAGWFSLLNFPVLFLLAVRYAEIMGWPAEWPAQLYLVVAMAGHFLMLSMVPLVLLVPVVLVLPRPRIVTGLAIVLGSLLVCSLAIDTVVLNLYRFHLNGMVWSLLTNGGFGEIVSLSTNTWTTAGAVAAGIVASQSLIAWLAWRWVKTGPRVGLHTAVSLVALLLVINLAHAFATAREYMPVTRIARFLPVYKPLTAGHLFRKLGLEVTGAEPAPRFHPGKGLNYPLQPLQTSVSTPPLNVMLIVIDGWRFDMLSPRATPNLSRFAAENVRFDHHSAAARCTRFGIFTLFYGVYGTYWDTMLVEQRGPVLIDALDQAGYQFGLFGSAPLTNPEFDRTVFSRVRDKLPPHPAIPSAIQRDIRINEQMLEFLKQRDPQRPFFGFMFYDATHAYSYPPDAEAPFQPACKTVDHLKLNNNVDPEPIRNRYLNAVHYVDTLAAQVLQTLQQSNLLDHTVVVVTGDHGEEFNETRRNYWGHDSNFSRYQTGVPFIVHWPGRPPAIVTHPTSHLDLAPTLMQDLLHCNADPTNYSNGLNLFDPAPRIPLVACSWDCWALTAPGRIDVMYGNGYNEHYDEDYRDLRTSIPRDYLRVAMSGMGRFYSR